MAQTLLCTALVVLWLCVTLAEVGATKTPVPVFMCADSGGISGAHELFFVHSAMRDRRAVSIPYCQTAYVGYIAGKNGTDMFVLAVTTGIGYASATACTVQLMRYSPFQPTSIVYLGTSGFSPFSGGFDPLHSADGGCDAVPTSVVKNAIGSVCITSVAFLMEAGYCTETLTDNQCERPNCFRGEGGHRRHSIVAPSSLADAISAANAAVEFPPMPPIVRDGAQQWWAANKAAQDTTAPAVPRLVRCAESTLNSFFAGAQRDYLCRETTSKVMNVPMSESVCAQAMEGFGFLKVMQSFPEVPVAILRTASNYDMHPIRRRDNGKWEQHLDYVSAEEYDAFFVASFHYSIQTLTVVLANYFFSPTAITNI